MSQIAYNPIYLRASGQTSGPLHSEIVVQRELRPSIHFSRLAALMADEQTRTTQFSLPGQVAIVTGAASGIGLAVVRKLAEAGCAEVVGIDVQSPEQTQEGVTHVVGDVADQQSVNAIVGEVAKRHGRVDILINNAGIAPMVRWPDVTRENWQQVLDVNLNGALHCTLAVLPHMRSRKYGRIVNVSSVGAFTGSVTAHPAYGVSKAGLIAMAKSLAKECASDGILVNCVSPGSIDTPMLASFGEDARQFYADLSPLKRQGSPSELADAILYLVSDAASYVTGTTLHVNGGALLV